MPVYVISLGFSLVPTVDKVVVDCKVSRRIPTFVRVYLVKHIHVQIQPSVAALVNNPHRRLSSGGCVCHPQALSTGGLSGRAGRPTEGGPSVLAAPCQGLIGVPRRAEGAHSSQVPVVVLRIVEVVCGSHVSSTLRTSTSGHHCTDHNQKHNAFISGHFSSIYVVNW